MSAAILRRGAGALVACAAALSLAACGGTATDTATSATAAAGSAASSATETKEEDAPSAKDLYAKTREASLAAKSAKLEGTVTEAGQKMDVELEGKVDGSNQRVEVDYGAKGTVEIITIDGTHYVKGDEAFWTSQGGLTKSQIESAGIDEKYVSTTDDSMSEFTFKSLLDQMFKEEAMSGLESLTTPVEKVTEEGVEAWKMTDGDAEVLVTADDKNYLHKIKAGEDATLNFSDWDAVEEFKAPPANQVIKQ